MNNKILPIKMQWNSTTGWSFHDQVTPSNYKQEFGTNANENISCILQNIGW